MRKVIATLSALIVVASLFIQCSQKGELKVEHLMTGPYVNCFLLWDVPSGEAALIDVGGPIDTLITIIEEQNLELKYFFFTHGHIDHLLGLPAVRDKFPDAKLCLHKLDYEDMLVQLDWIYDNLDSVEIAEWKADEHVARMFDFDAADFDEPDIHVEGDQIFELGTSKIETIHVPGHSRGSICYLAGDILFSGDVLMYRHAGRDNFQNTDPDELKRSIRKLYAMLPDSTQVYPGHGRATDIGSEKKENTYVKAEGL
jgi:glyoxylase-like metal-dependent hydrolase (beta-lactamase superfamily II)